MARGPLSLHAVRALLLTMFVAGGGIAGLTGLGAPGDVRVGAIEANHYCPDEQEQTLLRKINVYRKRHGRHPLRLSATLGAAAEHHSLDMAKTDHLAHSLSNGISSWENIADHGYPDPTVGENIAWGTHWDMAGEPFAWWKTSDGHNRTMLSGKYRAIGIARAYSATSAYGWYWTTTFGASFDVGVNC